MPQGDMGLLDYIAELEKMEGRLRAELDQIANAKAHALGVIERGGMRKANLPTGEPASDNAEETPKISDGPYSDMGNEEAALRCLEDATRPMKTAEVGEALKQGGIGSEAKNFHAVIFSSLRRLAEKGKVEKVGQGRRSRWVVAGRAPQGLLGHVQ